MVSKTKYSVIIGLLIILSIGSIAFFSTAPTKFTDQDSSNIYLNYSSNIKTFETLDQVIEFADNIVLGTIVLVEDFSDTVSKYTLAVDKNFKFDLDAQHIDVYEDKGKLITGSSYLLFLEELNHPLYSENSYTSFEKDMIIKIDRSLIVTDHKLLSKEKDLESIIKLISKSDKNVKVQKKDYVVLNKLNTITDLVKESDYILHVIPTELTGHNKNVTEVKANIIQQYKGLQLGDEISIFLPSEVQSLTEYMIFLKEYDGTLLPTTRKGSIIEIGTSEFEEALNQLNN